MYMRPAKKKICYNRPSMKRTLQDLQRGVSPRAFAVLLPILAALGFVLPASPLQAQPISRPAPFYIPTIDTSSSVLLPQSTEIAGVHGTVHLSSDGHIIAQDGTRLKFVGTELGFTAQFLPGFASKLLANRLHKLGFNAVRFNYSDYFGWEDGSFFKVYGPAGVLDTSYTVQPEQLARMDTLLYELRQAGIYAFFTITSDHHYSTKDGVLGGVDSTFDGSPLVHFWDLRAQELQHRWAKTLLSHVNPLTGIALGQDPAVPVVELTNEQSLFLYWVSNRINYTDSNNVLTKGNQTISYHQSRRLDTLYADYLRRNYGSEAGLIAAWAGAPIVNAPNLVSDPSFEAFTSAEWQFYTANGAQASQTLFSPGQDSATSELIRIAQIGPQKNWTDILLYTTSPRLGLDTMYKLSFWAKIKYNAANGIKTRAIYPLVNSTQGNDFYQSVTIDTSWKKYEFTFRSKYSGPHNAGFALGGAMGDVLLDNISITKQQDIALYPGESLNANMVVRIPYANIAAVNPKRVRDQVLFMDSLEISYFSNYHKYLRDTLKVKQLVNYSQSNYWATVPDFRAYSGADVTEGHSAFDYVSARSNMALTDTTFMIRNNSMLKDQGGFTLGEWGASSVAHKAHVVTMQAPSLNQYGTEMAVVMPAYAAFQDWDGIFYAPYAWYREELFSDIMQRANNGWYYYSIVDDQALLALMPTASALFRYSLVAPAMDTATITHDEQDVWQHAGQIGDLFGADGSLDPNIVTTIGVRQEFNSKVHTIAAQYPYVSDTATKSTFNGEVKWSQTSGLFRISTPLVIGYAGVTGNDSISFSPMSFTRKDQANDQSAVYYIALDGKPISGSSVGLLTLSTRSQNSGMQWRDSLGIMNWGSAPMVMSAMDMFVKIRSTFDSVNIYPLDGTGNPTGAKIIAQRGSNGEFTAEIDQQRYPSMWFIVQQKATSLDGVAGAPSVAPSMMLSPNPAHDRSTLVLHGVRGVTSYKVVDDLGRTLLSGSEKNILSDNARIELSLHDLRSGHYTLFVSSSNMTKSIPLNVVK